MLLERLGSDGAYLADHIKDSLGVDADLVLGVLVQTQLQEVKEVVQVHLPIPFGIKAEGQVYPGQFPCNTHIKQFLVVLIASLLVFSKQCKHLLGNCGFNRVRLSTLLVVFALIVDVLGVRPVAFVYMTLYLPLISLTRPVLCRIHCLATKIGMRTWKVKLTCSKGEVWSLRSR